MTRESPGSVPGLSSAAGVIGNHHLSIAPGEARGHDADQRSRRAIQDEILVQDSWIGAKVFDPGLVAQNENGRRARLIIRRLHYSAEERRHAEKFKCPGRDVISLEAQRPLAGAV